MSAAPLSAYDEIPYESYPFVQTHPDRLATVATLLGMAPVPVGRCRVLELGCAAGGNLIPMALELPESRFVGIDLSGRQIAEAQKTAQALALTNIEFKHLSILDVGPDFGQFDYVIAHGVFSWVPTPVQDKILEIAAKNMTPSGVAYISYNTYPGWHMRGMIRDMMCYHVQHLHEPLGRANQARNLLDFLADSVSRDNTPYGLLLKSEVEALRGSHDSYLIHEHLEEVNEPIYFHQFVERAAARGLRYLGEAAFFTMLASEYPPEVANALNMLSPDLIHTEQYLDFLRNRMFRQTLLCHAHVTPNYTLSPEQLAPMHIASAAKPVSAQPGLAGTTVEQFRAPDGATLSSADPIVKAAMVHLAEVFPQTVPFDTLRAVARARLGESKPDAALVARDTQQLGNCLLSCYMSAANLVELHLHSPRLVLEISPRPVASPLARLQAATGPRVTNLRHEIVNLDEFERPMMCMLDGTHDRAALVEGLAGLVAQRVLQIQEEGRPVKDAARVRRVLATALEEHLSKLARAALLVG